MMQEKFPGALSEKVLALFARGEAMDAGGFMDSSLFNGTGSSYDGLTADTCALLLIDHQTGLMPGLQTTDGQTLKNNTLALARTATTSALTAIGSIITRPVQQ